MGRFRLLIEYDGTRYSGWQVQRNARTVQGEMLGAFRELFGTEKVEFQGAGRTDAGVHAVGQVAHLDVPTVLAPEIIRLKVNDLLPPDINIVDAEKAPATFHARHDAVARSYLYQLSRRRTAFGKRYVWWVKDRLDLQRMRVTAEKFLGLNDFRSFTDDDPAEKSTDVLIQSFTMKEEGDLILVRVVGSHFLWKLVRRIVGVLVEAGRGKLAPAEVITMLQSSSETPRHLTAPPSGLFLEKVYYRGEPLRSTLNPILRVTHER